MQLPRAGGAAGLGGVNLIRPGAVLLLSVSEGNSWGLEAGGWRPVAGGWGLEAGG